MSRTDLPGRPLVGLAPPPDGLDRVRREARRRRRRRATVVAAGGTGALAIATALTLSLSGGGLDTLRSVEPTQPGLSVSPAPAATGAPAVVVVPHDSAPASIKRGAHQSKVQRSTHRSGAAAVQTAPQQHQQTVSAKQPAQPTLRRFRSVYNGPAGSARICGVQEYGNGGGNVESAQGWCLGALTSPTSNGVKLTVQLCRDSTGAGKLSYNTSREVDLTVRRGSHTVWQWSTAHPGSADPHQLTAATNGCWNWQLVWPDITQAGARAGHGSFAFVARTTATEIQAQPTKTVQFTY